MGSAAAAQRSPARNARRTAPALHVAAAEPREDVTACGFADIGAPQSKGVPEILLVSPRAAPLGAMRVIMRVVVVMMMIVPMRVPVIVIMLVLTMLTRIQRVARIVGEHQRLHGHGHGLRGHADAA